MTIIKIYKNARMKNRSNRPPYELQDCSMVAERIIHRMWKLGSRLVDYSESCEKEYFAIMKFEGREDNVRRI